MSGSEEEKQPLFTSGEDEGVVAPVKRQSRNKTGSRVYYTVLLLWVSVLLLLASISLGSFGLRQNRITNFYNNNSRNGGRHCILYVNYQNGAVTYLKFSKDFGVCGFVFWGLTSLLIVALSLVIYFTVLLCAGLKV